MDKMKLENMTVFIREEAKRIANTSDEAEISHYDMFLKDIIALSLSLRHQDSDSLRVAGNKMLRNLQWILNEKSELREVISELYSDYGESKLKDKNVINRTAPHIEFLNLC